MHRLWSMINKFRYCFAPREEKLFSLRKFLFSLCLQLCGFLCSLTSKWRFRRRMKKFEYRKQTRGCLRSFKLIYLWVSGARRYFKNYANFSPVLHFVDREKNQKPWDFAFWRIIKSEAGNPIKFNKAFIINFATCSMGTTRKGFF